MKIFIHLFVYFLVLSTPIVFSETIWDLQAVNTDGTGSHPKVDASVGSDPASSENRIEIEGIALNAPGEILDTDAMWQVYIQSEDVSGGGIAAWAGSFYDPNWPRYPEDIEPGDRIRVNGFLMNARGKVNINERHSAAPGMQYVVTKLNHPGLPEPILIPDVASCNFFDQSRASGGERYQSQWVKLENIRIASGTWGSGQTLKITDDSGEEVDLLLSSEGDFDSYPQPTGSFDAVGIFDQEDMELPFHEGYRLWVKSYSGLDIEKTSDVSDWEFYE